MEILNSQQDKMFNKLRITTLLA